MEFISTQKFLKMSPRKLRVVANMVRDLTPTRAVELLPNIGRRAAQPIQKVIKTAIANAKVQGVGETNLIFKEIQIGEGPRLKRYHAGSRGRAKPYTHDMAHIRVVLTESKTTKSEAPNTKSQTNEQKPENNARKEKKS
jgi:large subunit ribosomal protein L22